MKKNKGVLTLEAALVLPLFVFLILFICQFMKISFIYDTVQTNIYNTAKFVNGYSYLYTEVKGSNIAGEITEKVNGVNEKIEEFVGPEIAGDIKDMVTNLFDKADNKAVELLVGNSIKDEFKSVAGTNYVKNLGLSEEFNCEGSNISFGEDGHVEIIVEYTIKVGIPLVSVEKDIKFRNKVKIMSFS